MSKYLKPVYMAGKNIILYVSCSFWNTDFLWFVDDNNGFLIVYMAWDKVQGHK